MGARASWRLLGALALGLVLWSAAPSPVGAAAAAESPYLLPWPGGVVRFCAQGNNGIVSHKGSKRYAWDFSMPVGSPVWAARAGTVVRVVDSHTGNGLGMPNNLVAIDHGDGTVASYLHIRRGGSRVRVGDVVAQGQWIAYSGNVGKSLAPHLHFHVKGESGATLRVTFRDVRGDGGIPRMFKFYRSGNRASAAPPPAGSPTAAAAVGFGADGALRWVARAFSYGSRAE